MSEVDLKWLVAQLRACVLDDPEDILQKSADTIDTLQAENARLLREIEARKKHAKDLEAESIAVHAELSRLTAEREGKVLCKPEVMAYAAFAGDGNIRMWCKSSVESIKAAGYEPFALYAPTEANNGK